MAKTNAPSTGKAAAASAGSVSVNKSASFKKGMAKPPTSPTSSGASTTEMGDIFGALRTTKVKAPPLADTPLSSSSKLPVVNTTTTTSNEAKTDSSNKGLFRAAAASVEMNDDDFFGEVATTAQRSTKRAKKTARVGARQNVSLEKEGVDRVITEDELMKLTSGKAEAGTTPNCPFDCDCCF